MAPVGRVDLADVQTITEHLPADRLIKARHDPQQRRFTAADAAQNCHTLTGPDLQVDALEYRRVRLHRRRRIRETNTFESQLASEVRLGQVLGPGGAIHGHVHQSIKRLHGRLGLLKTYGQPYYLTQRCSRATSQHHGSNQRPHTQVTGINQVNPGDDQHHGLKLLEKRDHASGRVVHLARFKRGIGRQCTEVLPAPLHVGFTAHGFQGFQTFYRLDQHALLERRLPQVFFHGACERPLNGNADDQNQWNQHHRNPAQWAPDGENHRYEQQHEWQIRNSCQGCRGCKITHRLKFTQLVGKRAG